jgi:hypothetical protein
MCKRTCFCTCCERLCEVPDCGRAHYARGWCGRHYKIWKARGDANWQPPSLADRFWAKVDKTDECWLWTGFRGPLGYGRIGIDGRPHQAHRVAWRLSGRELIKGYELDHLCRNPPCVNPNHLEQVTHKVNMSRSGKARQTHCKHGHVFDEANTHVKRNGTRSCRACHRNFENARRARLAA